MRYCNRQHFRTELHFVGTSLSAHIYFLEVWNELKAIISYFEKKFSKAIMVEAPGNIKKKNVLHDEIITEV
jgi:hypothetical protein